MTNKRYISEQEMKTGVLDIVSQMYSDDWRPDYIVGVTRGGLIPAVMMSHYTGVQNAHTWMYVCVMQTMVQKACCLDELKKPVQASVFSS
jgi:hypoxanthine phosphoribosyltransferase